ncbi:ALMA7 [Symbiodinium sp. CCMP2592]|nr:ALMA7 [Symbiodinium sp. CCMP2592]
MRGGRATRRPVAKSGPAARSPDEQRRLEELSATLPALQAALAELREAKVPLQRRVAEAKQAGTRYDRACALETRLALLENVQVREVEWTISDYSALLENCPKGQCITSPTFAAGGVPNMQLVFHPNGSKDASDGYSSIALRIPEGMSVSRVLYVNQDHFGPNIVKQAVEGYTNAARISPPSAPLRGTAADIIVVGVRELYQHGWAADPMLQKVLLIGDAPAAEINFELLKEQRERRLQQERERCRQEAEAKRQALADEQEVAEEAARRAAAAEAEALAKVVSAMDEPVSPDQVMMQGAVKAAQERAEKAATKVESPEEQAAREKKEQAYAWLLEYQRQQAEEKAEADRLRQERERAEKEVKMEADKRRKAEEAERLEREWQQQQREEREYEEAARRSEEEQAEAMAKLRREREEADKMEAERRRRRDEEEQAEIQRRAEQLKEERRREEEERRREDEARRRLEEEVRQAEEEALRMEQQQQREAEERRRQLEEENRRLEEERQRKAVEKRAEAERTRQRQEELRRLEEQRRAFERAEEALAFNLGVSFRMTLCSGRNVSVTFVNQLALKELIRPGFATPLDGRLDMLEMELQRLKESRQMGMAGHMTEVPMTFTQPQQALSPIVPMYGMPHEPAGPGPSSLANIETKNHGEIMQAYKDIVKSLKESQDKHNDLLQRHSDLTKHHVELMRAHQELLESLKKNGGGGGGAAAPGQPHKKKAKHPALGVVRLDYDYPPAPGDSDHPGSFGYEVYYRCCPGLTFEMCQEGHFPEAVERRFADAIKHLEARGCSAITGDCGFMMAFHMIARKIAAKPIFMSSMVQCPIIAASLEPEDQILLLTANDRHLKPQKQVLLSSCGFDVDEDRFLIKGCQNVPGFEAVALGGKVPLEVVQPGIVKLVQETRKQHPRIAAILLECTELPPYADALRYHTGLPVWDAVTAADFYISAHQDNPRFGHNDWQEAWDGTHEEYELGINLTKDELSLVVSRSRRF